jgi:hypothetical protein
LETNPNHLEIIETLRRQIEAERATAEELRRQNDLAEKTLNELQRGRQAEILRARVAFDTNEKVTGLVPQIEQAFQDIKRIDQRINELEAWLERASDILLLLLSEKSPVKVREAMEDLEAEIALKETDRRKLIRIHTRNLVVLNEQAALHGMDPPLDLLNQIEVEKQALKELDESLRGSDGQGTKTGWGINRPE